MANLTITIEKPIVLDQLDLRDFIENDYDDKGNRVFKIEDTFEFTSKDDSIMYECFIGIYSDRNDIHSGDIIEIMEDGTKRVLPSGEAEKAWELIKNAIIL